MYLFQAEEIFDYWERYPPVYQMVSIIAQMIGWKPERSEAPRSVLVNAPDAIGAVATLPGMSCGTLPDWAKGAVLDFEEIRKKRLG